MNLTLLLLLLQAAPALVKPEIVKDDPRFDQVIAPGTKIEKIADGHLWTEGPVWNRKEGFLLFSDITNNAIFQWKPNGGESLFLKPSGYTGATPFPGRLQGSNGLTYDPQGRLVMCEHGDRRITRLEADKTKTVLAERFEGKRFNSPNDLVYKSNGDLYFTDPPYGLPRFWNDTGKEMDYQGVFRLSKDGKLTLLVKDLHAPNGIAFSPDEKTLYVANSDPQKWMAYGVKPDGTLDAGRVFFDATSWKGKPGVPDGMKVDKAGNLIAGGQGGIHVIAPDGTHLGLISFPVSAANCAFGGDGSVLYVTATTAVWRVQLVTKGIVP